MYIELIRYFILHHLLNEGTGLGLSLSYDIIKTHGEEMKVETNEGEGSTFIIQLPR